MVDEKKIADATAGTSTGKKKTMQIEMLSMVAILSLSIFCVFALFYIWNSRLNSGVWPLLAGSAWGIVLLSAAVKKEASFGVRLCSILLIVSGLAGALFLGILEGFARGFMH